MLMHGTPIKPSFLSSDDLMFCSCCAPMNLKLSMSLSNGPFNWFINRWDSESQSVFHSNSFASKWPNALPSLPSLCSNLTKNLSRGNTKTAEQHLDGKERIDQIVGHLSLEMFVVYGGNFPKRFHFISLTGQSASQLAGHSSIHSPTHPEGIHSQLSIVSIGRWLAVLL